NQKYPQQKEPGDEPRNLVQEIVGIEHRRDLATQVEQGRNELPLGRGYVIFRGVVRRGFIRWKCLAHLDVSSFRWEEYDYTARESLVRRHPAGAGTSRSWTCLCRFITARSNGFSPIAIRSCSSIASSSWIPTNASSGSRT